MYVLNILEFNKRSFKKLYLTRNYAKRCFTSSANSVAKKKTLKIRVHA